MNEIKNIFNKLKSKHIDFAVIKLSLFYVLIIMTISVSFSLILHRISYQEINRGLGRQLRTFWEQNNINPMSPMADLEKIRQDQINEANKRLTINLIYFNILILVFSSITSYFFAKKTLEPIEKSMEEQNRFTADASHELRTPLTAMKTEIEVALRDKKLNLEEARNLLNSNLEEVGKLESLSNALLKLAKAENINNEFEEVNLWAIINAAHKKIQRLSDQKMISIKISPTDKNDNFIIDGEPQSLTELFVILLDNAVKYSPENSEVIVSTENQGEHIVIKIKDEGIGIKESDLPYIFNRFYRADNSRNKEKVAGYGLGLSIAKQIVDMHNGAISVNSKIGKGSEFKISL